MEIRAAKLEDREEVLKTVDEFNDFANSQGNNRNKPSSFSQKYSIGLYNEIVSSNRSKLFIAFNQDQVVGYLEIHQVPRFMKNYLVSISKGDSPLGLAYIPKV